VGAEDLGADSVLLRLLDVALAPDDLEGEEADQDHSEDGDCQDHEDSIAAEQAVECESTFHRGATSSASGSPGSGCHYIVISSCRISSYAIMRKFYFRCQLIFGVITIPLG